MPVRARGNMFQVDFTWNGQRIRQGGFHNRLKAEEWEEQAVARLRLGQPLAAVQANAGRQVTTLQELYDRTYDAKWRGRKGEGTAVINAKSVLVILGEAADPNSIGDDEVERLVNTLKKRIINGEPMSGSTINRKLSALTTMLRYGVTKGWVDKMPIAPRQPENRNRIRWLSLDEEARALTALYKLKSPNVPEMEDLIAFLVDTGMRISEALRLRWTDFDQDGTRTWARVWESKNGEPRSVPLTARAETIVTRRKAENQLHPQPGDFLFTMTRHQANKLWDKMKREMGLQDDEEFVIHALRHTCASRLLQDGVDLVTIQNWLGHKDFKTTLRYSHIAPRNLLNAVRVLEQPQQPKLRLAYTG